MAFISASSLSRPNANGHGQKGGPEGNTSYVIRLSLSLGGTSIWTVDAAAPRAEDRAERRCGSGVQLPFRMELQPMFDRELFSEKT